MKPLELTIAIDEVDNYVRAYFAKGTEYEVVLATVHARALYDDDELIHLWKSFVERLAARVADEVGRS
jgi:hypothetical protein